MSFKQTTFGLVAATSWRFGWEWGLDHMENGEAFGKIGQNFVLQTNDIWVGAAWIMEIESLVLQTNDIWVDGGYLVEIWLEGR